MSEASQHRVVQGECLASLAHHGGLPRERIWEDSANAELHELRDPYILRSGDQIIIPTAEREEADCATEQRHRFRRHLEPTKLRIRLLENDEPRAEVEWKLFKDDELVDEGMTDGDGCLEATIDPCEEEFLLKVGDEEKPEQYRLQPGSLDPIENISGVQARLSNLGHDPGPIDNIIGPLTRRAIRQFQHRQELEESGEPDETTRNALRDAHGC